MIADLGSLNNVDLFFIILTLGGVLFSFVVNCMAAKITTGWLRKLYIMTASLSLFYIPAYALALTPLASYQAWSSFMLGFSWVVWWGAPWSGFALFSLYKKPTNTEITEDHNGLLLEVTTRVKEKDKITASASPDFKRSA